MEVDTLLSSLDALADNESRLDWLRENNTVLDLELVEKLKSKIETIGYSGELENALQLVAYSFLVVRLLDNVLAEALLFRAWANILQFHEYYEDSLEISKRAVAIYEEHGTPFDVAVARTVEVGVLGALERFDEAIDLAHWIRPHFERANFTLGEARLANALARVYTAAWRLEEALPEYEHAYDLYQQLNRGLDAAWVLHNIGALANRMDRLDMAWQYFESAFPAFLDAGDKVSMIKAQFNMARIRWRQSQSEAALQHLAQARTYLEELVESPDKGYVDLLEARVRWHLNQPKEALMLLQRALHLFDNLNRHMEAAETLVELGHLFASEIAAESMIQGLIYLEQAEIRVKNLDVLPFSTWIQLEQGELLYLLGRSDEAAGLAKTAVIAFSEKGQDLRLAQALALLADCRWRDQPDVAHHHYNEALAAAGESAPLITIRCWQGLGRLLLASGNAEAAETAYKRAVLLLEELRHALRSHQHQAGFLEDKQFIAEGLLNALQQQVNRENDLLFWVERFKAATLADLLLNQPQDQNIDKTITKLLAEREEVANLIDYHLFSLQAENHTILAQSPQRGPAIVAHDKHQAQVIVDLRRQLQLLDEKINRQQDPTNAWREGKTIESIGIHRLLNERTVLIAYYSINDRLFALSVTHNVGDLQIHPLSTTLTETRKQWQQCRRYVMRTRGPIEAVQKRLSALYESLFAPLSARLQEKEHLIILPHRDLFQIPFAALYDAQGKFYLIESWRIQSAPSATVLAWCRQLKTNVSNSLLVGYPGQVGQDNYLPGVEQELDALSQLLPESNMLLKEDATATNLLADMQQKCIVHLAGHAYYESELPLESGMPLAGGRWLRASDLYLRHSHLGGAMVVLSGCETGRGRPMGSDILGLTSAFLYAGATAIVAGLWKVDDEATVALMTRFYRNLLQGSEIAEALRRAQLTLLRETPYSAPYYWAPFSLSGDSRILFPGL